MPAHGFAQSLFQVGGNMGSAAGPLLAAFIVVPHGQHSIVWFSAAALVAMLVLFQVGGFDPQWKAINLRATAPGLTRFPAAQQWLDRQARQPTGKQ